MKKALLTLGAIAGFMFVTRAQEGAVTSAITAPDAPEITFEAETIDYGTVEKGANGVREFKFKNTGKSPLTITGAAGSCGCTVPSYPKEPIPVGGTGVISVKYDTERAGPINKYVTVSSNAKTPTKTLYIKGEVKAAPAPATDQAAPAVTPAAPAAPAAAPTESAPAKPAEKKATEKTKSKD